jgi:hypothetical protein
VQRPRGLSQLHLRSRRCRLLGFFLARRRADRLGRSWRGEPVARPRLAGANRTVYRGSAAAGHSATCPGRRFKSCRADQYFRLDNLPRKPLWEGLGNEQCLQENQSCPSGPIFTAPIHNRVTSGSEHGRARRFSGWTQISQPRLSSQSGAEESAPRQSPRQFGTDRDARTRRGAALRVLGPTPRSSPSWSGSQSRMLPRVVA